MYTVKFSETAIRDLKKSDVYIRKMLVAWIEKNLNDTENPRQSGKALVGNFKGLWRYRVGEYRIISQIDDTEVTILLLHIGHRKEIYS